MKTTITPKTSTNKKTKAGVPFWVIEDSNEKRHTVWDNEIAEKLEENFDTPCSVEVVEKGDFSNIRAFYGQATEKVKTSENTGIPGKIQDYKDTKLNSILLSYAKDIFLQIQEAAFKQEFDESVDVDKLALEAMRKCVRVVKAGWDEMNK